MRVSVLACRVASVALFMGLAGAVQAKDWISSVDIKPDGIDVKKVSVRANDDGYTTVVQPTHNFKLHVYAYAKSGKRIAGMKMGTNVSVSLKESDGVGKGVKWTYTLPHRDIGSGSRRSVSRAEHHSIRLDKVIWLGGNPQQVCEENLVEKLNEGWTKPQVLSAEWDLLATAQFALHVVAAKPNKAKAGNVWLGASRHYDSENTVTDYPVRVRCLAAPGFENQIQPQQPEDTPKPKYDGGGSSSDERDPSSSGDRDTSGTDGSNSGRTATFVPEEDR